VTARVPPLPLLADKFTVHELGRAVQAGPRLAQDWPRLVSALGTRSSFAGTGTDANVSGGNGGGDDEVSGGGGGDAAADVGGLNMTNLFQTLGSVSTCAPTAGHDSGCV